MQVAQTLSWRLQGALEACEDSQRPCESCALEGALLPP